MIYLLLTCIAMIATSIAYKLWRGLMQLSRVLTLDSEWSPNRRRAPVRPRWDETEGLAGAAQLRETFTDVTPARYMRVTLQLQRQFHNRKR